MDARIGRDARVERTGVDRPNLEGVLSQDARPAAGRGAEIDRDAAVRIVEPVLAEELLQFELGSRDLPFRFRESNPAARPVAETAGPGR